MPNNNIRSGRIIIISGPSGVGKSSVVDGLVAAKLLDKFNIQCSISLTTRPPRNQEVDGRNYYFISRSDFLTKIQQGEMIEYVDFLGNFYGTSKKQLQSALARGMNVLLEIEMNGALRIMKLFSNVLSIFLSSPKISDLETRIRSRATEPAESIALRLKQARIDMKFRHYYQYQLINVSLPQTVLNIKQIFERELNC